MSPSGLIGLAFAWQSGASKRPVGENGPRRHYNPFLIMKRFLRLALLLSLSAASFAAVASAAETAAQRDARMQWWREARFGMFVHWGLYSG